MQPTASHGHGLRTSRHSAPASAAEAAPSQVSPPPAANRRDSGSRAAQPRALGAPPQITSAAALPAQQGGPLTQAALARAPTDQPAFVDRPLEPYPPPLRAPPPQSRAGVRNVMEIYATLSSELRRARRSAEELQHKMARTGLPQGMPLSTAEHPLLPRLRAAAVAIERWCPSHSAAHLPFRTDPSCPCYDNA